MKNIYSLKIYKTTFLAAFLSILLSYQATGQTLPTAMQTYNAMTMGWNLGNTLEATGGEIAWGNPLTTQLLIDSVKAAGFNTVRIPCAWDSHADQNTLQIDAAWMARVKQVVDYCVNANMYVVLNIHWDGGWLESNCTTAMQASVNKKQNAYWTQIATTFKNYDGRLLFASANEPAVTDATGMDVLLFYHQTFINAVRATGGNNNSRVLVIQGPSTDIAKTNTLMNTLPTDKIANHLMVEIHYYDPYNFCLMLTDQTWGNMFYFWGKNYHSTTNTGRNPTYGEEAEVESLLSEMKAKFVDKGIPMIMGEIAVEKRTSLTGCDLALHLASREYYYRYLADATKRYGLRLMYWDAGGTTNTVADGASNLFNRSTGAVADRSALNALMDGYAGHVTGSAINGPTAVCPKATDVAYTIPSVDIATSYTWTLPSGATIAAGANTNSIKVNFGTTSGNVTVKASNSCVASIQNASLADTVKSSCSVAATQDGVDDSQISVYPNPFSQSLQVLSSRDYQYMLLNMSGNILESGDQHNAEIGNGLSAGIYLLKIKTSAGYKFVKVVKK